MFKKVRLCFGVSALLFFHSSPYAVSLPGEGITVQPIVSDSEQEIFQTLIVSKAFEALGYTVKSYQVGSYDDVYAAVAEGKATYMAVNWDPLHRDKYENAGGSEHFFRGGEFVSGAAQGYLIDKKTALKHDITNLSQFSDPKIAALFDVNGDGLADLMGCEVEWGCNAVIEHQLTEYQLQETVDHHEENYIRQMEEAITRLKRGFPIFYYTWTPYWVSGTLVPGKDVIWLQVPYSALPGARSDVDTTLPNNKNYGFELNSMRIVLNRDFASANPAAAKLASLLSVDINDISVQNMIMRRGQNSPSDIERHVRGWIVANQQQFDLWVAEALQVESTE
ncbi:glycine betaine/L-proline ABC transporter substrate-binding protein ProX [Thaumasiovibrio subtropicus]|uniref:glycine betaine/L-proline ABC transporter substrate-binding protein ProX n=1 Tax=Thaumasiovibrio subtropicus TaxID=1891207 RepID=UPI000B35ABD2|nr:glycine betaine/L-proline ABC transporter substrate-binding protein ProX [Thaumasiovibrio subtropicus]